MKDNQLGNNKKSLKEKADAYRIVAFSNQIADYPPCKLNKLEFQALLVLISCIDSTEKPVYGIDDLKEEMERKGILDRFDQMQYLEDFITEQNTFRIKYQEYAHYFSGQGVRGGGGANRALEAALSLNSRSIEFRNPRYKGAFVWFQAVYQDKLNGDLVFVITSFIKPFLMGLRRDFLQMLAESTIGFDGKYSIPIFIYMKNKLYDGQSEFHGKEDIKVFKERFGLNKTKTYDDFGQFRRRVLDKASADSLKSGDIKFFFEGKAKRGSRKIAEIHYHIYRIKDILQPSKNRSEDRNQYKDKLAKLTKSQHAAYCFLADKGVNGQFILEQILSHKQLKYESTIGFEDIYLKLLWQFFLKKTKATKKAGAFVSWWKNGKLTSDILYAKIVDKLHIQKSSLSKNALKNRLLAKDMNHGAFKALMKEQPSEKKPIISIGINFNFDDFKRNFPQQYSLIKEHRKDFFKPFKNAANYEQLLENSVKGYCEKWFYEQHGKK